MATTITNLSRAIKIAYDDGNYQYFVKGKINIWHDEHTVYITDETKPPGRFWSIKANEVSGSPTADALVTTLLGYDGDYNPTYSIAASNITTAAVITAITTESNWATNSFVDPGGILAQIESGQVYIDITEKIMYYYNGATLVRWAIDNIG